MFLWIILGAALLIAIGLIALNWQALQPAAPGAAQQQTGDGLAWGPADAPVKIINYSNFGCGHCKTFAQNQGKSLREEYEASGKVRFEFKTFMLGSPAPDDAANAAICAADQGRFWDYHDLVFANQALSADSFSKANLKRYGAQIGLDGATFASCVDGNKHRNEVYQMSNEGTAQGVNSTPTFFLNGKRILGAVDYADLKKDVEAALEPAS